MFCTLNAPAFIPAPPTELAERWATCIDQLFKEGFGDLDKLESRYWEPFLLTMSLFSNKAETNLRPISQIVSSPSAMVAELRTQPQARLKLCTYELFLLGTFGVNIVRTLHEAGIELYITLGTYAYPYIRENGSYLYHETIVALETANIWSTGINKMPFPYSYPPAAIAYHSLPHTPNAAFFLTARFCDQLLAMPELFVSRGVDLTKNVLSNRTWRGDSSLFDLDAAKATVQTLRARLKALDLHEEVKSYIYLNGSFVQPPILLEDAITGFYVGCVKALMRPQYVWEELTVKHDGMPQGNPDPRMISFDQMLIETFKHNARYLCWFIQRATHVANIPPALLICNEEYDQRRFRTMYLPLVVEPFEVLERTPGRILSFASLPRPYINPTEISHLFMETSLTRVWSSPAGVTMHLAYSLPWSTISTYLSILINAYLYLKKQYGFSQVEPGRTTIREMLYIFEHPQWFFEELQKYDYKRHCAPLKLIIYSSTILDRILELFQNKSIARLFYRKLPFEMIYSKLIHKKDIFLSLTLNLEDPYTQELMTTPVRSFRCAHVRCFDLHAFISAACSRDLWRCPVCGTKISPSDLYRDIYCHMAVRYVKETGASTRTVSLHPVTLLPTELGPRCSSRSFSPWPLESKEPPEQLIASEVQLS
ncbi:Zinc finger domain protein [Giardia muris]|uniref:Zinc finger domain protein n=1 Tax=Giardia muris TaxID=5742 RepID=A0A4Z1TA05_GIAMU|nr:Zinc finger domain protein [Giardia muris]|eukprot:TNJ29339.1 Zinc finger domain protein [Giardia muris]